MYPTPMIAHSPSFSERLAATRQVRNDPTANRMEIISVSRKTSLECERPANRPEHAGERGDAGVDVGESRPARPRSRAHGSSPLIVEQRLERRSDLSRFVRR